MVVIKIKYLISNLHPLRANKVNFHFRIFISVVSTNGNRQNILPKINLTSTHSPVTNRPAFIQFPYIV